MGNFGFGRKATPVKKDFRKPMGRTDFKAINAVPYPAAQAQRRGKTWSEGDLNYFSYNYESYFFDRINEDIIDEKSETEVYAALTAGQRMFHSLCVFMGQVRNGGVSQFFFNSGSLSAYVLEGLRLIEAHEMGSRFQHELEAASAESSQLKRTWQAFQQTQDWSRFQDYKAILETAGGDVDFDSWFYKNTGPLEQKIVAYINAHPEEFVRFWDDDPELKQFELTSRLRNYLDSLIETAETGYGYPIMQFAKAFTDTLPSIPDGADKIHVEADRCRKMLQAIQPVLANARQAFDQIPITEKDGGYKIELLPTSTSDYHVTIKMTLTGLVITDTSPIPRISE